MSFQIINDENNNPFFCAPPPPSRPTTRICQTQDPYNDVENPFIIQPLNFTPRNVNKRRVKSLQTALKLPPIKRGLDNDLGKIRTGAVEIINFQRDLQSGPLSCSTRGGSSGTSNKKIKNWINIVIVGDSGCGKTTLLETFTGQHFYGEQQYLETFERTTSLNQIKGEEKEEECYIGLKIWDVSGLSDLDRFRPLAYTSADGILCCFSIDDLQSFNNLGERWLPELQVYCENCPIILVGLKNDLRKLKLHKNIIPYETCKNFAQAVSMNFFQCSSINGQADFVFNNLARMIIKRRLKHERKFTLSSYSSSSIRSLPTNVGQQQQQQQQPVSLSTEVSAVLARVAILRQPIPLFESSPTKAHSFSSYDKRRTITSSIKSGTIRPESHNNHNSTNSKRVTRMNSMMTLRTPKREKCTIM